MRRRRSLCLLAAAALVGAGLPMALAANAAAPATSFTPGLTLLNSDGGNPGGAEPSIAVDRHDNVYVSGPVGVPTGGCPVWTIHPGSLNAQGLPYEYDGTSDTDHGSVGGGDCDISTGPNPDATNAARYDDVSVSSLSLLNLTTNNTTDGHTFMTPANTVGTQIFGVDRQWQDADYGLGSGAGVHYLTVHDLATTNIDVAVSTDGGYVYTTNSTAIDATHQGTATGNNGNHFGTIVHNPVNHKLYIPFIAPSSPTDSVNHVVYVAEGTPGSTPQTPISWTDYTVYTGPADQTLDHIFPAISIDAAGRVYVAWAGDTTSSATNRIQISHMAVAGNATAWTPPVFVDGGANHSNMFPWLISGRDGNVDVTWYAGKTVGSGATCPSGQSGQPDDSAGVANNCFNQWRTRFAQSFDNGQTFTRSSATGLIHKGSICDQGTACTTSGGDRTLLDFFDMALDAAGGANIAYASDLKHPGTAEIDYTRQCTGRSATTGEAVSRGCDPLLPPPPPAPTSTCDGAHVVTDPAGDATNPTGAGGTDPVDVTNVAFADAGDNVDVTTTLVNASQVPPPGTTDEYYYVTWTGPDSTQYGVQHVEPGGGYTVGEYDQTSNQLKSGTTTTITGSYTTGPNGTVVWHVPKNKIGNPTVPVAPGGMPAAGNPYAVTIVGEGALGTGLVFVQPADRAPNTGTGPSWSVCAAGTGGSGGGDTGQPPDTSVPEVPYAALLPGAALALIGASLAWTRRRRAGAGRVAG